MDNRSAWCIQACIVSRFVPMFFDFCHCKHQRPFEHILKRKKGLPETSNKSISIFIASISSTTMWWGLGNDAGKIRQTTQEWVSILACHATRTNSTEWSTYSFVAGGAKTTQPNAKGKRYF